MLSSEASPCPLAKAPALLEALELFLEALALHLRGALQRGGRNERLHLLSFALSTSDAGPDLQSSRCAAEEE